MICPHCNREILLAKEPDTTYASVYYCQNCRMEHIVVDEIEPGDYVIEHKECRFYIDNKNNRARIEQRYMYVESDTSITFRWYTVLELPSIPQNLNKDTVEEKLKLYLLFS